MKLSPYVHIALISVTLTIAVNAAVYFSFHWEREAQITQIRALARERLLLGDADSVRGFLEALKPTFISDFRIDYPEVKNVKDSNDAEISIYFDEANTTKAATISISFREDVQHLILVVVNFLILSMLGQTLRTAFRLSKDREEGTKRKHHEFTQFLGKLISGQEDQVLPGLSDSEMDLAHKVASHLKDFQKLGQSAAIGRLATQVAHDIRSPLAALSMAEHDLAALPEDTRLIIRSAIGRIQDIASQLMLKAAAVQSGQGTAIDAPSPTEPTLLSAVIETLLAEKRMQYRSRLDVNIESFVDPGAQARFAQLQPREFKRVISNLINNAVEAIPDSGAIVLTLETNPDPEWITLKIKDTGRGIPAKILARLGERGFSHQKEGGSGLGIHHARTSIESWGGKLAIESTEGTGTTVLIHLPLSSPPAWFKSSLEVTSQTQIVILDDDQSIHQVWQGRVESAASIAARPRLLHFSTPTHLRDWYEARSPEERNLPAQYLIDFEILGSSETGLDLIESLGIAAQSVLVTSRYEEPTIRARCQAIGLKLLPKALAGFVPLTLQAPPQTIDAILIDDDSLVHTTWNLMARRHGKNLRSFTSVEALRTELDQIPKDTPIYIDSNLGKGIQGEDLLQELSRLGYQHLVLATGYESGAFLKKLTGTAGFKGVRDKTPPWAG